jgi:hypothetical protein
MRQTTPDIGGRLGTVETADHIAGLIRETAKRSP